MAVSPVPAFGVSKLAQALRARLAKLTATDGPVLILGERGSGREWAARLLHDSGPRRAHPFVRVDSQLADEPRLGEKLRRAHGGTVLFTDVAHTTGRVQHTLLQFLRKSADAAAGAAAAEVREPGAVRILASSDVELAGAAAAGLLDPELAERLGQDRLLVPPLRERPEDIPALAAHFLGALAARAATDRSDRRPDARPGGKTARTLAPRAIELLSRYSWPGNVAELRDVVRRAALRRVHAGDEPAGHIELADVEAVLPPLVQMVPLEQLPFEDVMRAKLRMLLARLEGSGISDLHEEVLRRVERPLFEEVLRRTGGNQIKAAAMLGINRNTLRKKLADHALAAPDCAAGPAFGPAFGSTLGVDPGSPRGRS